jgi:methylmalonic aciduria homocystinuria type C protein
MTSWTDIASALAARIETAGFDVFGAIAVDVYNRSLPAALCDYRLPELGDERALVLVVGNTRRMWPRFLAAHASNELATQAHPVDVYSKRHIEAAATQLAAQLGVRHAARYSSEPPPEAVAMQRLAALAGAAELAPTGLCVHPVHGPWLSLRAAVVFETPGPSSNPSPPTCSTCMQRPCMAAREQVAHAVGDAGFTRESFDAHWQAWLAMRDACPVGRQARFSDQQIRYHYLKHPGILREPQH